MRKKLDSRLRELVEAGLAHRQRSMFVVVGDKGRDQVVNLYYMLTKLAVRAAPSVLWCYKKDLYLSSHRKKRIRQTQKLAERGLLEETSKDPFALFVSSANIRYCYYSETHRVLGNTYGMLVLQDFEALTPNILARTIETVEGGGLVVLLLSSMASLTQLYGLSMDVHARLRTEAHAQVVPRFNERMVLSLAASPCVLLTDDELNILPTSSHARVGAGVGATDGSAEEAGVSEPPAAQLKDLQASLADTQPAGPLVSRCATLDQAKAVVTFLDAASERTLRSTVALTAARGRGKSAALGLAIAGALGLGYSNIFVTAPSPENLRTLFAFVLKGLDRLGFQEHQDYDLVESTNPAFGKAIVRVNVFRSHRQTVQYIQPQHAAALAQAELLVIDEAAAIPLPVVRSLLGPYLVFLCSTVNGYEGTGRSLSLKLIHELRAQGAKLGKGAFEAANASAAPGSSSGSGRTFREVVLREPIRYAPGDGVERWLNQLLLLDAGEALPPPPARLPHPSECQLFHVERDTLFSHHRASEAFLSRVWALYVASHYKNSPNDLLLLSDAPAHRLFVLLGPVQSAGKDAQGLPDVLCVLQVALEGAVSAQSAQAALASGSLPQGDLIPWTLSQQFQDPEFAALSGARVVRIATHPDLVRAGYGARALELLSEYFAGRMEPDLFDLAEDGANNKGANNKGANSKGANNKGAAAGDDCLHSEKLAPRSGLPPLLVPLADRRAERLHWLGVSCGLTGPLLAFWKRTGMQPLYLRQTAADATGEHTVIMLKSLWEGEADNGKTSEAGAAGSQASPASWLAPFFEDFSGRLRALLAGPFKPLPTTQALSLLSPRLAFSDAECAAHASRGRLCTRADGASLSAHDLARLEAYTSGVTDHHLVADLVPSLAHAFFSGTLPATLSHAQAVILLHVGLQARPLEELSTSLNLPAAQVLALYSKALHRLHRQLRAAQKQALERSLPDAAKRALPRLELMRRRGDHRDAAEASPAAPASAEAKRRVSEALQGMDLDKYAVRASDEALQSVPPEELLSGRRVSVAGAAAKKTPVKALLPESDEPRTGAGKKAKGKHTPGKSAKKARA